ncbi:enoyl-CoA hydratase/isomerase family protein [Alloyangia pacifica]|uniref:Enoyl-CoA hydratase/carnithine racemase n=1 Tax=Alloyangia pacifica TaxID=311180 RepID=A0A1I6V156_9RHOB|nr:enoyl-CoA hydratase/isomerase family protein [Alloyangia pacifica]SDI33768.1 Enoyl-CoA hydratase/carnithine racemase [Alloyangia pacifica]SFT07326.1 Enoyl-CoA hydratase/carnithine racemase [Alloyangia pacifica]
MSEHVKVTRNDGIMVITLDKPAKLNAWDRPMRDVLLSCFRELSQSEDLRALVLTGTGERAFCAGQDLSETRSFDGDSSDAWIEEWRNLYSAIRDCPKPVIAALNGLAAGSAFQVALLCDIRVGHAGSKMGQPEINSGIVSVTGFWIIREALGLSRATELVLSGRLMEAEEAHRVGILHHVVPRDEVLSRAIAIATDLANKSSMALRLTKRRIRDATQADFEDAIQAAQVLHHEAYSSGEPQKVMDRFLDRSAKK